MPVKMAKYLCPEAVFIKGDMERYTYYSRIVTDIIAEQAPVYEKSSIDEHYIDVSGLDKFFGTIKWTKELRKKIINEIGLPISAGISVNKTVAKIATGEAKPMGEMVVDKPVVNMFLDPLPVKKIPMIGIKTQNILKSMGIQKIKTLREMPVLLVERLLGKNGISIWEKANGIDNSPVISYHEQKSLGAETTFEEDCSDIKLMTEIISEMTTNLSFRLRKDQWLTSCLTVKIRYSDFDTHTIQKNIPYTAFDHILIPIAKELFQKLYTRRVMIRLIGVRFSNLVRGVPQLNLFEDTTEMINLYRSIDYLKKKYGDRIIRKGFSWH
jgi:DNA polymerase-4